jgi:hypothetical protein
MGFWGRWGRRGLGRGRVEFVVVVDGVGDNGVVVGRSRDDDPTN